MTDASKRRSVAELAARRSVESVAPDPDDAIQVLDGVVRPELELVMFGTDRGLFTKSLTLAYDAARKAVEAVMLASGLRARGHVAVADFAELEFVDSAAEQRDARAFASARIARHADEYPRPGDVSRSSGVVTQACVRLVGHWRGRLELDPRADLVPTAPKVDAYLRPEAE